MLSLRVTDAAIRMVKEEIVEEEKAKHDEVEIQDKSTPIALIRRD